MRYLCLVFLGLVLLAGQASAAEVEAGFALKIMSEGRTIGELYQRLTDDEQTRISRVVYDGNLYICFDSLHGRHLEKLYVAYTCYDEVILS